MKRLFSVLLQSLRQRSRGHKPALEDPSDDPPARRLVDYLLRDAANRGASEIQLGLWPQSDTGLGPKAELERIIAEIEGDQVGEDSRYAGREFAVRYRIAGELLRIMSLPRLLYPAVVAQLRELAGLTSAGREQPSDPKDQGGRDAPRGDISLRVRRKDGSEVLAEFDVAVVAEDEEEKVLVNINYEEVE